MTTKRPIAVFQFKLYRAIGLFIAKMRNLILNISTNSGIFVTPDPTVVLVTGHVDDLESAQAEVLNRTKGKAALRNDKKAVVVQDIYDWLMYVQKLADEAPTQEAAISIIEAAGFSVKLKGVIITPPLKVENTVGVTGSVDLTARGGPQGCIHEWQDSPNGTTWTNLPSTSSRKTTVTGLQRLSTRYFRHRLKIKDVPQAWDQPVNIVVL